MRYIMALLLVLSGPVAAHSWTPTYPKPIQSWAEGIYQFDMTLWNSRADVNYFTFDVFDAEFMHIPWAAYERTTHVAYLERKVINIYIKAEDLDRVVYVCSRTQIVKRNDTASLVSSRICSKVKR